MWVLRSTNDVQVQTLRLLPGTVRTIGRGPRADFVVDAALVSRIHCQLSALPDGLFVEDLKSTNGTFINDQRVRRSSLDAGDRLRLGRLEFSVARP